MSQLTGNPYFTAVSLIRMHMSVRLLTAYFQGFGLAGLATFGRMAQQGLKRGAVLLRRRMLVELEVTKNDDAYPWLLQWMYQRGHALSSEAAADAARYVIAAATGLELGF